MDMELKQLVVDEATKLKQHATADELAGLDFERLDPRSPSMCIYGQMTGDCRSDRAIELLVLCAVSYALRAFYYKKPSSIILREFTESLGAYSAIEFYIYQEAAKNKTLINFLKNKTTTLKVSDL